MKPLTPYQQSLVEKYSRVSGKREVKRWLVTGFYLLTGLMLIAHYNEQIPQFWGNWLWLVLILIVVWNVLGCLAFLLIRFVVSIMTFAKNQIVKETKYDQDERQKLLYKYNTAFMGLLKTGILGVYNSRIHTAVDVVVDWFLFAMMVTTGHPFLAIFFGGSLLLQYNNLRAIKKALKEEIATMEDSLAEEKTEDMDELMDRLFQQPKETDDRK